MHLSYSVTEWALGPLNLVSTTEELLGRKSSGSGLENRDYGPSICKKLALTSPTSSDRSVSIVRSRTQTTEFVLFFHYHAM
jgi:hypothetical protein